MWETALAGQQLQGGRDRDRDQRTDYPQQRCADQNGDHRDARWHPDGATNHPGNQQIVLDPPEHCVKRDGGDADGRLQGTATDAARAREERL